MPSRGWMATGRPAASQMYKMFRSKAYTRTYSIVREVTRIYSIYIYVMHIHHRGSVRTHSTFYTAIWLQHNQARFIAISTSIHMYIRLAVVQRLFSIYIYIGVYLFVFYWQAVCVYIYVYINIDVCVLVKPSCIFRASFVSRRHYIVHLAGHHTVFHHCCRPLNI